MLSGTKVLVKFSFRGRAEVSVHKSPQVSGMFLLVSSSMFAHPSVGCELQASFG
jgi:hypothetical protein